MTARHLLSPIPIVALAALMVAGCGGSSSPVNHAAASDPEQATAETPTTSTATQELPPMPAPVATWHFTWSVEGGYSYSGSLSLGSPEHINETVISSCTANSATDIQVRGEVELTNDTKGFSSEPVINIESSSPVGQGATEFGGNGTCSTGDVVYSSGQPLASGASDRYPVALVIPDYYLPEHPNGDPASLSKRTFKAFAQTTSSTYAGQVAVSGPDVNNSVFTLRAIAK